MSEGAKTEGLYLSLFVRDLRAANVSLDILGKECGSDPLTVVEFAKAQFVNDRGYDICYCVIDRDDHDVGRFNAARLLGTQIDAKSKYRDFHVIVSDPCIEFWFLLHFIYCRSPFVSSGGRSRGARVVSDLKKYIPNYSKSNVEALSALLDLTDFASENAKKIMADVLLTGESNPSTQMHLLVERIRLESVAAR